MNARVGLLAKCPESDDSDSNLVLNPQYNKVNRAIIDLMRNSGWGSWLGKQKYFSGLLKNSPKLVNLVKGVPDLLTYFL
jgi:hypothetical protein